MTEAVQIRGLLARNTEELDGVLRALGGEYVLPEAGGDLLRDGAGVLPTGAPASYPTPDLTYSKSMWLNQALMVGFRVE